VSQDKETPLHLLPGLRAPDPRQRALPFGNLPGASGTRTPQFGGFDIYKILVQYREARVPCALCTVVESSGSSPRKPGAHMLVLGSGEIIGTIGGGAIEQETIQIALTSIRERTPNIVERHLTHDLGMCCGGSMKIFVEPQVYPPSLWIFGAGHVAEPLCEVATLAGFSVTVVDERPEQTHPDRFPRAHAIHCAPPLSILDQQPSLTQNLAETFVVIVTHDHALDEMILARLLQNEPPAYLGVIGSVRKREKFKQRLRASGLSENSLKQFRTPMGLDIGAITPQEIAVSVVAELILVRRGHGDGAPMQGLGKGYKPKTHETPP
jgi:xanthine dehydrogenase accessory factor